MIPKSGFRFSDQIMLKEKHDPEKWTPVFGSDHAQSKIELDDGVDVIPL
jgi:hypothetical protein